MLWRPGLLVWSVALLERQRDLAAAAAFAVLLNMKHLFAAAAPVYFVYLLSRSCRWNNFRLMSSMLQP
jgi:alpha-1,3-glucosyltransferase